MKFTPEPTRDGGISYAECAPDLWLPLRVRATGPAPGVDAPTFFAAAGKEYRVDASLELWPIALQYGITSVRLYSSEHDTEGGLWGVDLSIDTELLRSLRLLEIKAGIAEAVGAQGSELKDEQKTEMRMSKDLAVGDLDAGLVEVAHAYVRGALSGRRPQKDVSEKLGVSIATAGRRVRNAVEKGYLFREQIPDGKAPNAQAD